MAMASPKALFLVLLAAALLVSCCYASRSPLATGGETTTPEEKAAVITSSNPAKCERMVPCDGEKCTEYCVRIGLGEERGFCSFNNLQFVCCCPIPFRPAATDIPAVSSSAAAKQD